MITREEYELLLVEDPRLLKRMEKSGVLKDVIVNFRQEDMAEFVTIVEHYENGGLYTIGGEQVTFAKVCEFALVSTYQLKNPDYNEHKSKFPKLYARKESAWAVLKTVQNAHDKLNKKFSTTTDSLRAIVEASL